MPPEKSPSKCPECGSSRPPEAGTGLCPRCLLGSVVNVAPPSSATKVRYVGDFELVSEIKAGGMGVVYRARQVTVNRMLALKLMRSGQFANAIEVERFRREAEAASALDHPNIVPIYEIGVHDGLPYFTMKLFEGGDLGEAIQREEFVVSRTTGNATLLRASQRTVATLIATVADAIQHAHDRGVLHRDIKPANILLDNAGVPHVTDFGLAKLIDSQTEVSQTGGLMGTPAYMSPEQAAAGSRDLTTTSDIYSLGTVLYEMLVGRPPFVGEDSTVVLRKVRESEPISPAKLNPGLDADLVNICLKCLEKEPSRRYRAAADLAADLRCWLNGEPISARSVSQWERTCKWIQRNPVVSLLASGLALSIFAGFIISISEWRRADHAKTLAEIARNTAQKAEAQEAMARKNAEASEQQANRSLYYASMASVQTAWERGNIEELSEILDRTSNYPDRGFEWYYWKRQLHLDERTFHDPDQNITAAIFSPDGQRIATCGDMGIAKIWDVSSGKELLALKWHSGTINSIAFSPDGRRVVTGSSDGNAKVWDAMTGNELIDLKAHSGGVKQVGFSPDGGRILTSYSDGTTKIWNVATGKTIFCVEGFPGLGFDAAFSPNGKMIAAAHEERDAKVWDSVTGEELLTLSGHTRFVGSVEFSSDGRRLLTGSWDNTARLWDTTSGQNLKTFRKSVPIYSVAISLDSQRVIAGGIDGSVSMWDTESGGLLTTFIGHVGIVTSVEFSPDGKRIVTAAIDGTAKLWNLALSVARIEIPKEVSCAVFSPDGESILTGTLNGDIQLRNPIDGDIRHTILHRSNMIVSVTFSPDQRRIALVDYAGHSQVCEASSGTDCFLLNGVSANTLSVAFTPDGNRIVTASTPTIDLWDASIGKHLKTFKNESQGIGAESFSPNGQWIVIPEFPNSARIWDTTTGLEVRMLKGPTTTHFREVECATFSKDGRLIVTGSESMSGFIWDSMTGSIITNINAGFGGIRKAIFTHNGSRIIGVDGLDESIKVWETRTGRELCALKAPDFGVDSLSISSDDKRLLIRGRQLGGLQIVTAASELDVANWQEEERVAVATSGNAFADFDLRTDQESQSERRQSNLIKAMEKALGKVHSNVILARLVLGKIVCNRGDLERGEAIIRDVMQTQLGLLGREHPDTMDTVDTLVGVLRQQDKNQDATILESIAYYIPTDQTNKDISESIQAIWNQAEECIQAKDFTEAIRIQNRLLALAPNDSLSQMRFAVQLLWGNEFHRHEVWCEKLLDRAVTTTNAPTAERIAKAYLVQPTPKPELLTKAADLAQRAVDLGDPTFMNAFQLALGMAKYRQNRYAEAEKWLVQAQESTNPLVTGPALLFQSMSYARQGKLDDARKYFSAAEKLMEPAPRRGTVGPSIDNHDVVVFWLVHEEALSVLSSAGARENK